jgi:CheY-like chemotaxis protein
MENNRANKSKTVARAKSFERASEDRLPFNKFGALVVDDDDLVRVMLRLALEREGFQVWVAANGGEAIDLYRRHRASIHVVLLDVQMPNLDGPSTLDSIRQLNPDVCACFVSGDTGGYEPEDLIRRGAMAVFHKPFRLIDLGDVVRRLLKVEPETPLDVGNSESRVAAIFADDLLEQGITKTRRNAVAV